MQPRKITIIPTKTQGNFVIESAATTLGELKADIRPHYSDFTDMVFYEGLTKTEYINDGDILPQNVTFRGETTNELVFMITTANKKIKSGGGLTSDRGTLYNEIKKKNLQEECKKKFGKNYTNCSTVDLAHLVAENNITENGCIDTTARKAILQLIEFLTDNFTLEKSEARQIKSTLGEKEMTLYTDKEIEDMFSFIEY